MTAAPVIPPNPITANDGFKNHYARTLRTAFVLAVLLHGTAFVLVPAFRVQAYQLPPDSTVVAICDASPPVPDIPDVRVPEPPSPVGIDPEPTPDPNVPETPSVPSVTLDPPNAVPRDGSGPPGFLAFSEGPVLVEFVAPKYPRLAREAGIEGIVQVRVRIDERGRVVAATVVHSDVTPAMDEAAIHAALQCRFKPARQRTEPVPADVVIPFSFSIR